MEENQNRVCANLWVQQAGPPSDTKQVFAELFWAQKPFCVPNFSITENRLHSAFLTFTEFKSRSKWTLIREGMTSQKKQ